jgi:hypothetical protein
MAGQSEFGRHPHRTPSQRLDVVYAAAIAAAVFAILVGLVWGGVWLLNRRRMGTELGRGRRLGHRYSGPDSHGNLSVSDPEVTASIAFDRDGRMTSVWLK